VANVAEVKERALGALKNWYYERRKKAQADTESKQGKTSKQSEASRSAVCVGLVMVRSMKEKYPLSAEDIHTSNGQVRGLNGERISAILKDHGIEKTYSSMGGRTTRASMPDAQDFLSRVPTVEGFADLSPEERKSVLDACEEWLIGKVQDFFAKQKLEIQVDLSKSGPAIISGILKAARERKVGGPIAQHLVGAKLAHRYKSHPHIKVDNFNTTAADQHLDRDGDFRVGDTAFHVTVGPTSLHIDKCGENIKNGLRPILLVPVDEMERAKHLAEDKGLQDQVSIVPIESFVGQNVEELGEFTKEKVRSEIAAVLKEYNRRVAEAESDQSLQIKMPKNVE
jgi:Domain of unknown function (DUF4928)